jgi:tripartite-type tricarboxylate transporter receptor subunit TctC
MNRRRLLLVLAGAGAQTVLPGAGFAQVGEQPVHIIFPFAAGGVGDVLGRMMAEHLRTAINKPVIVEDRTGAAGRIGIMAVKSAPPNGTTLLLTPIAPICVYPHVYPRLDYDPFTDFEPLSQLVTFEFALAVAKRVPASTLKELVAWLRANPNEQTFATPAVGTLPYFFAQQFGREAGLNLVHANYRGSAAAVQDLIAGHIAFVITSTSDFVEQHKAGLIRVLATSETQPFIPDIPTFREAGFDIHGNGWYAMYAPAKTAADILDHYSAALAAGVNSPEAKRSLLAMGLQPTGTTRGRLAAIQKADSEFWRPMVKASGFVPEQ